MSRKSSRPRTARRSIAIWGVSASLILATGAGVSGALAADDGAGADSDTTAQQVAKLRPPTPQVASEAPNESASAAPSTEATKGAGAGTGENGAPAESASPASSLAAKAAKSAAITPQSVATGPIAGGQARIVVHAADATTGAGVGAVSPAPNGTTIEVRRTAGSGSFTQSCTIDDGSGSCSVDVPVGNSFRYTARISGAPSGYRAVSTLGYGTSDSVTATTYEFESGVLGNSADGDTVHLPTQNAATASVTDANALRFASRLAVVRANPPAIQQCGAKIALVLDQSSSMDNSGKQATLKSTVNGIIDELSGTPAQIAGFTFASEAGDSHELAAMNVPGDVSSLKNWVTGLSTGGYTNWDEGLSQVAGGDFDLVIFVTDGNPTIDRVGATASGTASVFQFAERGIYSANAIKAAGSRIVALGIGVSGSGAAPNLAAISGPTNGSDYYTASAGGFGQVLHDLVTANCEGKLFLTKQVEPWDGTAADRAPVAGWPFDITPDGGATQHVTTPGAAGNTIEFPLTFSSGSGAKQVTVRESDLNGYSVIQSGGKNAVCTVGSSDANIAVNSGAPNNSGFTVAVGPNQIVTCTVTNKEPKPGARVQVDKQWVINGADPVPDGQQGFGLSATLSLDGATKSFGAEFSGYLAGDKVAINETFTPPSAQCRLVSSAIVGLDPASPSASLPKQATLQAGANHFRITNTVTCDAVLTLNKVVDNTGGGTSTIADFPLRAARTGGPILSGVDPTPGPSAGLSGTVPAGDYDLSETLAAGYSPSEWVCAGGTVTQTGPGAARVKVAAGAAVTCTVTNTAIKPTLTLVKKVDRAGTNDTTQPSAWTLSATSGSAGGISAAPSIPVPGDANAAATPATPLTAGTYALGESGPTTYSSAGYVCSGSSQVVTSVTLKVGDVVTCTVTNRAKAPKVLVTKHVYRQAEDSSWQPWDSKQVDSGDKLRWVITATNAAGTVGYTGPLWSDSLASVLAGTTGLSLDASHFAVAPVGALSLTFTEPNVSASTAPGTPLAGGSQVTVTFEAVVAPATQLAQAEITHIANTLIPGSGVTPCVPAEGQVPDCTTDNPLTAHVAVSKSVEKLVGATWTEWDNQVVRPGDQLRWTITAHNTSSVDYAGPLFSDNLDDVLKGTDLAWQAASFVRSHTSLVGLSLSAPSPSGNVLSALTLPGQHLAAGTTTTVRYQATVRPADQLSAAHLVALSNVVLPGDGVTPCEQSGTDCRTDNPFSPQVTVTKTVTKTVGDAEQDWDGKNVAPGDHLTWTITVTNSSPVAASGQLFTDNLSESMSLTDLANSIGSFTTLPMGGIALELSGKVLTGSAPIGGLAPGDQVTVRYSGTVRPYADLPSTTRSFANVVVPTGDTECPSAPGDGPDCTTTNQVPPTWTVAKSAVPPSGSDVMPGETVTYTLTVTNTGASAVTGVSVRDDLSDVLPYVSAPPVITASDVSIGHASYSAGAITWTIDSLPAGASAHASYRVKVADDAWGKQLRNVVTGTGEVPPADCAAQPAAAPKAEDAEPCGTTHQVPQLAHLTLTKTLNDEWNGPAAATDWVLVADGGAQAGRPDAPGVVQGITGQVDYDVIGGDYQLSERPAPSFPGDPGAYDTGTWSCRNADGQEVPLAGTTLHLSPGDEAACAITNTAKPAHLTLVKLVQGLGRDGALEYSDAQPSNWLLRASGAIRSFEGPGDPTAAGGVNAAEVPADTYRLTEAAAPGFDPIGFESGDWRCLASGSNENLAYQSDGGWFVDIALGQSVTCRIVNTETQPRWTLEKSSDPASGARVEVGQVISYTVTARYLGGVPQDVTVTDDLSGVLDAANLDVASITPPPSEVTAAGEIVWHVTGFHADQEFTYQVTVKPQAFGKTLRNVAFGGSTPPEQCADEETSACTTTHWTPKAPELKLVKSVHLASGLNVTARHWMLDATPDGVSGPQPHPDGALRGLGGFDFVPVLPGDYRLAERAASADELDEGASPIDASKWRAGLWRCVIANEYAQGGPRTVVLPAGTVSLIAGDLATCEIVNSQIAVDLVLEKSTPQLGPDTVLDAPDQFDYRIRITNKELAPPAVSAPATGATVTDPLPAHLKVVSLPTVPGWSVTHSGQDSAGRGGTLTFTQAAGQELAVGASRQFDFTVQVEKGAQGNTVNTACVTSDEADVNPRDNCDTVTTRTKAIVVQAQAVCVLDAGRLKYSITTLNVPAAETSPVTATWRDQNGDVVRVDTLTGDAAKSGELVWPGAVIRSDGVSIGWPGWREIRAGETPQFENMILDPSLPSYQWRLPMTVEFQVNPETTITTVYPSATPRCEATRNPGVQIAKTASVTQSGPGQSFSYALDVKNTDLGAAHDVTVSDKIASYLKVTGVEYSGTVAGVAARWQSCEITGRSSDGYGGLLTCRLDNVLGYQDQAPPITLHVTVHPAAVNSAYVNTGKVCWTGETEGCNTSTVRVDPPGLAFTGGTAAGLAGGALGAAVLGLALWLLGRQLRRRSLAAQS